MKNLFQCHSPQETVIFKQNRILKLEDIHRLYIAVYMYKILKMNLYPSLQVDLGLEYPEHTYSTRTRNDPRHPLSRVTALRINYKYQCVKIWNFLPNSIREQNSTKI